MQRVSRRNFLVGAAGLGAAGFLAARSSSSGMAPREVKGFLTTADVDKAEREGAMVFYGSDTEVQIVALLQAFNKVFPRIDTTRYMREQVGRLYAKMMAERQAGTYLADVIGLSDYGLMREMRKKEVLARYLSPYLKDYDPQFQSDPPGYFTWYSLVVAGIGYNTNLVPEKDAPKAWKDLADPKFRGALSLKDSASGVQKVQWYMLRKLYGDQFWKDMAAQKPRGLAAAAQQWERAISGEDKIVGVAQVNHYLQYKAKGAPVGFVLPSEGVVVSQIAAGIVHRAPHPEAAKLFMDWFLSPQGQAAQVKASSMHSPRKDVAPIPGAPALSGMKILLPDWDDFFAVHEQYVKEWNTIVGIK